MTISPVRTEQPVGRVRTWLQAEGRLSVTLLLAFGAVAVAIVAFTRGRLGWTPDDKRGVGRP